MPAEPVPRNLFRPGDGGWPPYLAGRESALERLAPLEHSLRANAAPARNAILHGPRGNGNTVLMEAFLRKVKDIPKLQALRLTPDEIADAAALCRHLARARPGRRLLERIQAVKRMDVRISEAGMPGLGIEFEDAADRRLLPDLLIDRLEAGPVILAVDEAHVLDLEVGRILLNMVQKMRQSDRPLLLMLAGTPGLKSRLGAMDATFWGRCEDMPVGLLDRRASADALAKPLEERNVGFEPAALEEVVGQSSGYPYFLQLWGEALTGVLDAATTVSSEHVRRASPKIQTAQAAYYRDRYNELHDANLLSAALAVGRAYASDSVSQISRERLYEIIAGTLPSGAGHSHSMVADALGHLAALGYVWEAEGDFEAGIPSLMSYVASRAAAATPAG